MTTANERLRNQFRVWQKGKHVMLTIQNPDKKQINGRYIRKPAVEIGVIHLEASHEPL